jgi:putative ABC transport system permease protein
MNNILRDVRYALRAMRRAPGFTAVVLLTTALGVGANTTIFTVVYAALLRPLPYPSADRLIMAGSPSPANILDWQREATSFEAMAALSAAPFDVTGFDRPVRIDGATVTGSFFSVMGVSPAIGRPLNASDDGRNSRVVVIADAFRRQYLGASASVIGSAILINGQQHTIVGVMPPGFTFPETTLAWVAPRFSLPTASTAAGKGSSGAARQPLPGRVCAPETWSDARRSAVRAAGDLSAAPNALSKRDRGRRSKRAADSAA